MRLSGRRVVVTGASSGIGRALAHAFADRGAVLTLAARRLEKLEEVAREIVESRPGTDAPAVVRCDVTNPHDVSTLVGGTVERLGSVDVLVNNAGVSVFGDEARTSIDDYRHVMEVNFFGALYCTREALPFMLRQEDGLIVNISTVAAIHGVPYLAAYGASKAALVALSQSLRAELAGTGVRVMIVYPGYTESEIYDTEKKVGGASRPAGRYAPASTVAEATVRAIERGARDLIATPQGRLLWALDGLAPPIVEHAMRKIARELRAEGDDA